MLASGSSTEGLNANDLRLCAIRILVTSGHLPPHNGDIKGRLICCSSRYLVAVRVVVEAQEYLREKLHAKVVNAAGIQVGHPFHVFSRISPTKHLQNMYAN